MGPAPRLWLFLAALAACDDAAWGQGRVVRDGTLGSGPPLEVVGPGTDPLGDAATYLITPDMGKQHGGNLFHSFESFGIGENETATFTGPDGIDNVISRVTGGDESQIDGMLRSTIPGADVWLLNPSGVVFGEGAKLDVPGSFHASTGDYLGFGEGDLVRFYADPSRTSVLSTAPPVAFGFLGEHVAEPISVTGATLETKRPGDTLSLVGGDVVLDGATLRAGNGRVNLTAVASSGEVVLGPADAAEPLDLRGFETLGEVRLQPRDGVGSLVDVSGDTPGSVFIRGGRLVVEGPRRRRVDPKSRSQILADNDGLANSHAIISVKASESVVVDNGLLSAKAFSVGDAGSIEITGFGEDQPRPDVTFRRGPPLPAGVPRTTPVGAGVESTGAGAAGKIRIEANDLVVTDGVALSAPSVDAARDGKTSGNGGAVEIFARSLALSKNSYIGAAAIGSTGNGGTIDIDLGDEGTLLMDAQGGYLWIVAGVFGPFAEGVVPSGSGGDIKIRTGSLEMRGGQINVPSESAGDGGNITIDAREMLVSAKDEELGWIGATASENGNGGSITIGSAAAPVHELTVRDGGQVKAETLGTGKGGNIALYADSLVIESLGSVTARSEGTGPGAGPAGSVTLQAHQVKLFGGTIATNAEESGGGNITIAAKRLVHLDNGEITASVTGGVGGDIHIDSDVVLLQNGSSIVAQADAGSGGRIFIAADNYFAFPSPPSVVDASAGDPELSGTVEVSTPDVDLAGTLTALPASYLDAASLMKEACAARRSGERAGSFAVRGNGGIPAEPDGWLPGTVSFDVAPGYSATSDLPAGPGGVPLFARGGCR